MNQLPKFFIAGAQKSGTTTLHDILSSHSGIFLPKIKETKFFVDLKINDKGASKYKMFFQDKSEHQICGEVDPDCLYFEHSPKKMLDTLGKDLKIFVVLRNPIERAISHYLMTFRRGLEDLPLKEAIHCELDRINKSYFHKLHYSYISRGKYLDQIKRFYKFFGKENIKIFIYEEDFLNNRQEMIDSICNELGLDTITIDSTITSNPARNSKYQFLTTILYSPNSKIRKLLKVFITNLKLRKIIRDVVDKFNSSPISKSDDKFNIEINKGYMYKEFFEEEIKLLENELGRNLDCWKNG